MGGDKGEERGRSKGEEKKVKRGEGIVKAQHERC